MPVLHVSSDEDTQIVTKRIGWVKRTNGGSRFELKVVPRQDFFHLLLVELLLLAPFAYAHAWHEYLLLDLFMLGIDYFRTRARSTFLLGVVTLLDFELVAHFLHLRKPEGLALQHTQQKVYQTSVLGPTKVLAVLFFGGETCASGLDRLVFPYELMIVLWFFRRGQSSGSGIRKKVRNEPESKERVSHRSTC